MKLSLSTRLHERSHGKTKLTREGLCLLQTEQGEVLELRGTRSELLRQLRERGVTGTVELLP